MRFFSSPEFIHFHDTVTSFPTVFFYIMFGVVVIYWVVTILGFAGSDVDIDADIGDSGDVDVSEAGMVSGILIRFGLYGVPFVFILTLVVCIGLLISFSANLVLNNMFASGILRYVIGTVVLLVTTLVSMIITGQIVKPLRKKVALKPQRSSKLLLGKIATVRSSRVDTSFGEAVLTDKGADLILKVRSDKSGIKNGDKVALVSYNDEDNSYYVVTEEEFNNSSYA